MSRFDRRDPGTDPEYCDALAPDIWHDEDGIWRQDGNTTRGPYATETDAECMADRDDYKLAPRDSVFEDYHGLDKDGSPCDCPQCASRPMFDCSWCGHTGTDATYWPYCSKLCADRATLDSID